MNDLLPYLLKSTLSLSVLYLAFSTIMRKEAHFALNRMVLLAIVISSVLIPLVILPRVIHPEIQQKLVPVFPVNEHPMPAFPVVPDPPEITAPVNAVVEKPEKPFPVVQVVGYIYLGGMLFSILILFHGLLTLLLLYRKAQILNEQGHRVFILEKDIPAFSFCKMIFISKADYAEHGITILTHEIQHIRLGHFYDLMLMELVKIIHWFNPIIYWLIQDLKAIHEFQADRHTLTKGIDVNKYQLLIIEKGVGSQRFALANSFNHCQIKKRITMMNKQMTSKAGIWKVATFLPLLALLLMAFGREGENVSSKVITPPEIKQEQQSPQTGFSVEIKKDGNYLDNQLVSVEDIVKKAKAWQKTNEEILLIVDNEIPYNRVDEVREALVNANIYFINQKSPDSDEIIYPAGDVTEMAKFTQGKWDDWMKNKLKHLDEEKINNKEYEIKYGFIIDKNGKVRDGHIIKGTDYPEINAAYEQILTQMPDWKPAKKGNKEVSVFYSTLVSKKIFPSKPLKK